MSYRIPPQGYSDGDPPPPTGHDNAPGPEEYPNNEYIQQAQEKIKKLIDRQHSDLKGKFDQIRYSLSQKESKVHQELDEILNSRVNELEECARNINSLNDTYRLNQQKLGTKTLGDVNLKILTTISESIENFRTKINKELNIRILWGSQNIEQSIQKICTITYTTEGASRHSPPPTPSPQKMLIPPSNPGLCKCLACDLVFSSPDELANHSCHERGNPGLEGHAIPLLLPLMQEPVQTVVLPVPSPSWQHGGRSGEVAVEGDPSSDSSHHFYCEHCQQYFSSSEMEIHVRQVHENQKRQIQTVSSSYTYHPVPQRPVLNLPPPLAVRIAPPGGQQQLSAAMDNFIPISPGNVPHYRQPAPAYNPPDPNPVIFSPLDQQQHSAHAFKPPAPDPSYQFMHPVASKYPVPATPVAQYQNQISSALPQPNIPLPQSQPSAAPVLYQQHPSNQTRKYGMEPIRKYMRRLFWVKQVGTLSDRIYYFDNFDGGFELMWGRREAAFLADVELEEGEHYGQLSMGDSEVIYPVKKFIIEKRAVSSQLETVQLEIHMNTEY